MGASIIDKGKSMNASNSRAYNRRNTCKSLGAKTVTSWTRERVWYAVTYSNKP
jgi:hypothetical protein